MTGYTDWVREIEILKNSVLIDEELELAHVRWQSIPDEDKDSAFYLDGAAADIARQCYFRAALQTALSAVDMQVGRQLTSHAAEFAEVFGRRLGQAAQDAITSQVRRGHQFWLSCIIAFGSVVALILISSTASYVLLLSKLRSGGLPYPGQTAAQQAASQIGAAIAATGSAEAAIWVARHLANPERIAGVGKYLSDLDDSRDPYVDLARFKLCLGPNQRRLYSHRSVSCTFTVVSPAP